jgi:hypothetical protein
MPDVSQQQQPDPAVAEAQRRLALDEIAQKSAEARQKTAEADRKRREAELAAPAVTPLQGTLSVDDKVSIECETLAYDALRKIAASIVETVASRAKGSRVVLLDPDARAALLAYRACSAQLDAIESAYGEVAPAAGGAPPRRSIGLAPAAAGVGAALRSVLDVAALLRADVEIKGKEFQADQGAFAAELCGQLLSKSIAVAMPDVLLPPVPTGEGLSTRLAALHHARSDAIRRVAALSDAERTRAETHLTDVAKVHAALEQALSTPDAQAKVALLAVVLRGEALADAIETGASVALLVRVLRVAGSNRVRRRLWGAKLDQSGGAIATYALVKSDGAPLAAGVLSERIPFVCFKAWDEEREGAYRPGKWP